MNVNEQSRIVEIWLTKAEKKSEAVRQRLKPMFSAYKRQGYLVAVFESGNQDLAQLTSALLCDNRTRLA